MKKNLWKPDTCDCEIEYEWDETLPLKQRVHAISKMIKVCKFHQGLADKFAQYDAVVDENTRKNKALGLILDNISSVTDAILQLDGGTVTQLKVGLDYKWSFDQNRNLEVDLIGFNASEKGQTQQLCDQKFGFSKVKVL